MSIAAKTLEKEAFGYIGALGIDFNDSGDAPCRFCIHGEFECGSYEEGTDDYTYCNLDEQDENDNGLLGIPIIRPCPHFKQSLKWKLPSKQLESELWEWKRIEQLLLNDEIVSHKVANRTIFDMIRDDNLSKPYETFYYDGALYRWYRYYDTLKA